MDYLGITPQTPDASSVQYPATEGEGENYQAASTNAMGARTWSKPSIPDSMSQGRPAIGSATARGLIVSISNVCRTWL